MYSRKVSPAEKTLLVADWASRPFANQLVVEGKGEIDVVQLKKAVKLACLANPGSRLLLKQNYFHEKWIARGPIAPVTVIENSKWDGYSSENAPFLSEALHPVKGPISEVILIPGETTRIVFRTNHGAMDGRGTQFWAEDVFAALNGETLIGATSRLTDMTISGITGNDKRNSSTMIRPEDCIVPTGKSIGDEPGIYWERIRIKGKFSSIVPQLSLILAKEAWKYQDGRVAILMPVDMRKRIPGLRSTNNLSSMIHFDVLREDTVESVQSKISDLLKGQYESLPYWYHLLSIVPLAWMKSIYRWSAEKNKNTDLYSASGVISNLGKISVEKYFCDGFTPETCFFIPPCGEGMSQFMTLSGSGSFVDILSATPQIYNTEGRIKKLLASVRLELCPTD